MVSRIIAAVDAEYAEVTGIRVRRAMRQLAAEGRPNGGRVFGYVPALGPDGRKTRAIAAEEAAAIRWAAAQILAGNTLASVARSFDAQGLAHVRKGRSWSPTHIRNLVTNPAVAGLRPGPEGGLVAAVWPAILDADTWRCTCAALTRPVTLVRSDGIRYRTTRKRRPSRRHLLSAGLAECGVCGAPLSAQIRRRPSGELFTSYICDPRVGKICVGIVGHYLERHVTETLLGALGDPEVVSTLGGPVRADTPALGRELDAVEADLADLAGAWGRAEIMRGEWQAAREPLARRAQSLRDRMVVPSMAAYGQLSDIAGRWDEMGLVGRRLLVAAVFERVEVQQGHHHPLRPQAHPPCVACRAGLRAHHFLMPGASRTHRGSPRRKIGRATSRRREA